MTTTTLTLGEVLGFIASQTTEDDLASIDAVMRARTKALRQQRARQVTVGTQVTLTDISPKYLNGMRGTVSYVNGARATLTLDAPSTATLRVVGRRKFFVPTDATEYVLAGVPLSSCAVTA